MKILVSIISFFSLVVGSFTAFGVYANKVTEDKKMFFKKNNFSALKKRFFNTKNPIVNACFVEFLRSFIANDKKVFEYFLDKKQIKQIENIEKAFDSYFSKMRDYDYSRLFYPTKKEKFKFFFSLLKLKNNEEIDNILNKFNNLVDKLEKIKKEYVEYAFCYLFNSKKVFYSEGSDHFFDVFDALVNLETMKPAIYFKNFKEKKKDITFLIKNAEMFLNLTENAVIINNTFYSEESRRYIDVLSDNFFYDQVFNICDSIIKKSGVGFKKKIDVIKEVNREETLFLTIGDKEIRVVKEPFSKDNDSVKKQFEDMKQEIINSLKPNIDINDEHVVKVINLISFSYSFCSAYNVLLKK